MHASRSNTLYTPTSEKDFRKTYLYAAGSLPEALWRCQRSQVTLSYSLLKYVNPFALPLKGIDAPGNSLNLP